MLRIRIFTLAALAGWLWLTAPLAQADTQASDPGAGTASGSNAETDNRQGKAKPAAAKTAKPIAPVDPNRRWIMKQTDHTAKRIKPKKPIPLKWTGAAQQKQCRAHGRDLAASFDKARFYSIQGDRCKTAQYGRDFLTSVRICQKACPDRFLESNGITPLMVRNMEQLEALGRESCLGTQPASKASRTAAGEKTPDKSAKKN